MNVNKINWQDVVNRITKGQYKSQWGQNFLINGAIIDHILQKIQFHNNIVEIGPGSGILSYGIIQQLKPGDSLTLVEKDGNFIQHLEKLLKPIAKKKSIILNIINGDGLQYTPQGNYQIISNIPYNITSQFFYHNLKNIHCKSMVIMIQKEVGEKLWKDCNHKDYGMLSALIQSTGIVKPIMNLSAKSFLPSPSVDSQVIYYNRTDHDEKLLKILLSILDQSFKFPRKQLKNNIINDQYKPWLDINNYGSMRPNLPPIKYWDWAHWVKNNDKT